MTSPARRAWALFMQTILGVAIGIRLARILLGDATGVWAWAWLCSLVVLALWPVMRNLADWVWEVQGR